MQNLFRRNLKNSQQDNTANKFQKTVTQEFLGDTKCILQILEMNNSKFVYIRIRISKRGSLDRLEIEAGLLQKREELNSIKSSLENRSE